ncbi:integrase core domain-containing protein [Actinosynnema sp. CA-299493]
MRVLVFHGRGDGRGMMAAVLLRLAYLGMTNTFALLRLLPMSDRDKDTEILALRHQLTIKDAGIDPAPERTTTTWSAFLHSQADALLACDFFETSTLSGTRLYVLAVIEHASHRILGHPSRQEPRHGPRRRGPTRALPDPRPDRKFPALFDAVLTDAGIQVVLSGVRIPHMNAIMERWVHSCRHELLDRTLIWNQQHLLHALREYEHFYNTHRPHQGIHYAPYRHPSPTKQRSPTSTSANDSGWAESSTSTNTPPDLHGRRFRQAQRTRGRLAQTVTCILRDRNSGFELISGALCGRPKCVCQHDVRPQRPRVVQTMRRCLTHEGDSQFQDFDRQVGPRHDLIVPGGLGFAEAGVEQPPRRLQGVEVRRPLHSKPFGVHNRSR